jgi:hypothetical protein
MIGKSNLYLSEGGLRHDTKDFEEKVGRRHCPDCTFQKLKISIKEDNHSRQLRICVISRRDLHDVGRNDMETIKAAQDLAHLSSRPATDLGSTRSRSESEYRS